jgi:uncharacterized membrane protein
MSGTRLRQLLARALRWSGMSLMVFLSLLVTCATWWTYSTTPLGSAVPPALGDVFRRNAPFVYVHIVGAGIALVLGPLQFAAWFRRRWPRMHRVLGRVYLILGVLLGGLAGLVLAVQSGGGAVARAGFLGIAVGWLVSGAAAFRTIRAGEIEAHRVWMIRNYAFTFGAVTLRLYLTVGQLMGRPFEQVYPIAAWLSWTLNLAVVEWWMRRAPSRPGRSADRAPSAKPSVISA